MTNISLATPALLFSAISLIFLAYTNRFLSYAKLVRDLKDKYMVDPTPITRGQIMNLRKRLNLIKKMQFFGVASLLLCVVSMFFIYLGDQIISAYIFGIALILLIISMLLSVYEIQISAKALEIFLSDMHTADN